MLNCYGSRDKAPVCDLYRRQVAKHATSTSPVLYSRGRLAITGVPVHWIFFILLWIGFLTTGVLAANDEEKPVVHLYLDMDFSNAVSSSTAIEQGIRTALSEVEDTLAGFRVELIKKDHRGNTRRSRDNLIGYLADNKALAVFTGLHSPPVLANLEFIHQKKILVLNPWAAAEEITRYPSNENWIFRLSVDDTKAGHFLVRYLVQERNLRRPALLLEQTGWGHSNEKNMTRALMDFGLRARSIVWFNWGIQESAARIMLHDIIQAGADSILLVGNAPEAKSIIQALLTLDEAKRLPIISHWGLTGGDFAQVIGPALRRGIDLTFLQTGYSFISQPQDTFGQQVLASARKCFPGTIHSAKDIAAPAGFIHAYDLTRLLIAAVEKVRISGDIIRDRAHVRAGLEQLDNPVRGLIKTYRRPFRPFDRNHPDAHEALSGKDLHMAHYQQDNTIVLLKETIE